MTDIFIVVNRRSTLESLVNCFGFEKTEVGYEKEHKNYSFFMMLLDGSFFNHAPPDISISVTETTYQEPSLIERNAPKSNPKHYDAGRLNAFIAQLHTADQVINLSEGTLESVARLQFICHEQSLKQAIYNLNVDDFTFDSIYQLVEDSNLIEDSNCLPQWKSKQEHRWWMSVVGKYATAYLRSGAFIDPSKIHIQDTAPIGFVAKDICSMVNNLGTACKVKAVSTFSIFNFASLDSFSTSIYEFLQAAGIMEDLGVIYNVSGSPLSRMPTLARNAFVAKQARLCSADKGALERSFSKDTRNGVVFNSEYDSELLQGDLKRIYDEMTSKNTIEEALVNAHPLLEVESRLVYDRLNNAHLDYPARSKVLEQLIKHQWIKVSPEGLKTSRLSQQIIDIFDCPWLEVDPFSEASSGNDNWKELTRSSVGRMKEKLGALDIGKTLDYIRAAPAPKSVQFMQKIEREASVIAPYSAYCTRSDCQQFIDNHKSKLPTKPPTNAMIARLDWMKETFNKSIPAQAYKDYYACYTFLNKNRRKSYKKG